MNQLQLNAHQVTIVAKENLPVVSIAPKFFKFAIYEGDDAVFTIFVPNHTLTQPLPVSLTVSQGASENFIDVASAPTSD